MVNVTKRKRTDKVAAGIKKAHVDFKKSTRQFAKLKPSAVKKCLLRKPYGSGPEDKFHRDLVAALKTKPAQRSRSDKKKIKSLSEQIGEAAAIEFLRAHLEAQSIPFDPKGVQTFSASGVFNIVYLYPAPTDFTDKTYKPKFVFVLEAKGGESQCGDCDDGTGTRLNQGTAPYHDFVARKMARSEYKKKSKKPADVRERARRKFVGQAVLEARKNQTGAYVGVRGGYTDSVLYRPEIIFSKKY